MAPRALLKSKWVRYVCTIIKIPLNLDIKAKNFHKTAYFSCYNYCLPGPSWFPIVHWCQGVLQHYLPLSLHTKI